MCRIYKFVNHPISLSIGPVPLSAQTLVSRRNLIFWRADCLPRVYLAYRPSFFFGDDTRSAVRPKGMAEAVVMSKKLLGKEMIGCGPLCTTFK